MNREEIEEKIMKEVNQNFNHNHHELLKKNLTDLFIELSNERCKEQINICYEEGIAKWTIGMTFPDRLNIIKNAPLPSLH